MPGKSEDIAIERDQQESAQTEKQEIDLFIGVFFDGTNNNKYQVMLGKMFRRQEILNKVKERINKKPESQRSDKEKDLLTMSVEDFISKSPETWTKVLSRTEKEQIYFGYAGESNGQYDYESTIEKKSKASLYGEDGNMTSKPEQELESLKDIANDFSHNKDVDKYQHLKDGIGQNATYTNVAILESIYKVDVKDQKKKRYSIYIEGSGTDMQFNKSACGKIHKSTVGLAGLGMGTGPSGVAAKVRKASILVQDIVNKESNNKNNKLNLHFDIYGFSRGSTCARVLSYVINANPKNNKTSYTEDISIKEHKSDYSLFTSKEDEYLKIADDNIKSKEIRFLGIFDTVSSIGVLNNSILLHLLASNLEDTINTEKRSDVFGDNVLKDPDEVNPYAIHDTLNTFIGKDSNVNDINADPWKIDGKSHLHKDNVKDYGLWATKLANYTLHICAMDEYRKNFALVDIASSIKDERGTELFIPGCHTDIGGGAAIGIEDEQIANKYSSWIPGSYGKKRYYSYNKVNKIPTSIDEICEISSDGFAKLGWIEKSTEVSLNNKMGIHGKGIIDSLPFNLQPLFATRVNNTFKETHDETYFTDNSRVNQNIIMYRHVIPGYSNLALSIMQKQSNQRCDTNFGDIPSSYKIPPGVELFIDIPDMEEKAGKTGREFIYPKNNNNELYRQLRYFFLHFSSNDQIKDISDNILVNRAEFVPKRIDNKEIDLASRIIYRGICPDDTDGPSDMHMFDYSSINDTRQPVIQEREPQTYLFQMNEEDRGKWEYSGGKLREK